jgi:cytochrome P450
MTLLCLITNPTAYSALQREIQGAASTTSSPIKWSELQSLSYLRAVVREGMRVWPPVGGLGFKIVPPGGDMINGFHIPGGTQIGQAFHGIGRSKAVWGEDADMFRPERWLNLDEDELRKMTDAVDTHFGAGKFSCLGKPLALMELHKSIFEVLAP